MLSATLSNVAMQHPNTNTDWYMDTGATSHATNNTGNLTSYHSPSRLTSTNIVVGNGSTLPILSTGSTHLTGRPFFLNHVLVSPAIVKNLISVCKFTHDNACSVEFDPYGFSVKDLATKTILIRSIQ